MQRLVKKRGTVSKHIKAFLIENNSQRVLGFSSVRELKEWARKRGYEVRRSPASDWLGREVYYTICYVILPTGEVD